MDSYWQLWLLENSSLQFYFSFPFNVHSLHGYFGYLIMVIIALHTYAILITSQARFFLCSSFFIDAFTENFDQIMHQLNLIEERTEQFKNDVQMRQNE